MRTRPCQLLARTSRRPQTLAVRTASSGVPVGEPEKMALKTLPTQVVLTALSCDAPGLSGDARRYYLSPAKSALKDAPRGQGLAG